jgi:Xaa-Pro aminopeptidase
MIILISDGAVPILEVEMELQNLDKKEMVKFLSERVERFNQLSKSDQDRLVSIAQVMSARHFSEEVILAGVNSTASVMEDLSPDPDDIMNSEQVQKFLRENVTPERRKPPRRPAREVKQVEREDFLESINSTLREARSVKGRHEIKKMRRILLGIDQRNMRQVLGRDAEEPIREIRTLLNDWAPLFNSDTK